MFCVVVRHSVWLLGCSVVVRYSVWLLRCCYALCLVVRVLFVVVWDVICGY